MAKNELESRLRGYVAAKKAQKRKAVRDVLFPRLSMAHDQAQIASTASREKNLAPLMKQLIAERGDITGSEVEQMKQRGNTLRTLISGLMTSVRQAQTNASAEDRKKLDMMATLLKERFDALATAEQLTRTPGSISSRYGIGGAKPIDMDFLENKYFRKLMEKDEVTGVTAASHGFDAANEGLTPEQKTELVARLKNRAKIAKSEGVNELSDVAQFEEGIRASADILPKQTTYGVSKAEIESFIADRSTNDRQAHLLRMSLYPELYPNEIDNVIAHYQSKMGLNELNTDTDEAIATTTVDNMIASLMSGDESGAMELLEQFHGVSGLSPFQLRELDYNQTYQDQLLTRMKDPNAGKAVIAARDMVFQSPEYQTFKNSMGFETNDATLKALTTQLRRTDRKRAKHDRMLLSATRRGATPETLRALSALQNRVSQPKTPEDMGTEASEVINNPDPVTTTSTPEDTNGKPKKDKYGLFGKPRPESIFDN